MYEAYRKRANENSEKGYEYAEEFLAEVFANPGKMFLFSKKDQKHGEWLPAPVPEE